MAPKRSKNQLRREKLKQRKLETVEPTKSTPEDLPKETPIEPAALSIDITDNPLFDQFRSVLDKFTQQEPTTNKPEQSVEPEHEESPLTGTDEEDTDDDSDSDDNAQPVELSKRQLRLQNKISMSTLKSFTNYPQLVELQDRDSHNPYLLISIKTQPNMIPVPINWSSKKDYLSSRKGLEKLPFELPKFIRDTGISAMRNINDDSSMKQKQREKVQPKMGTLDMDYEKLYSAFYKFQTKPRLYPYGEIYEEGKESNDELGQRIASVKPGVISKEMRIALGMATGDDKKDDLNIPPAWITIMKDIGKPPSYRDLIIPGLDIGYRNTGYQDKHSDSSKRKNFHHWGQLDMNIDDDEEEEEESEVEESEEDEVEEVEQITPPKDTNQTSLNDILSGLSTDKPDKPKKLYTVLKEKKSENGDSLTGYTYDLNPEQEKEEETPQTRETHESSDSIPFKF
ncbi:SF3B2 Splicing factor 3B subunit 2 [Candida maltosa Xu316]